MICSRIPLGPLARLGLVLAWTAMTSTHHLAADETTTATGAILSNLGFETGTLAGWTATGEAFLGQPIEGDTVTPRRPGQSSRHAGRFWIGGYEKFQDKPTGTLTSDPIPVEKRWLSFLVGGGASDKTRVEVLDETGKVLFRASGEDREDLRRVATDVGAHLGRTIRVRLVDEHTGHWGHLNFDDLQFHDERPATAAPVSIALMPDEYPHAGLTAEEAVAAMRLPPGFRATVFASEPDVKQPIAMTIDERGRVWVAEAYEYPTRAQGDTGRDRILIFEDTDGDGRHDKRTIFYEGLNLVSGLEVGYGGVWVGAAPYLLFIPDADGDDRPDGEPVKLLNGWGYQDTHETLNSFIWGPDGWLYGCHGVFTHSRVGKPGTPDDQRVLLNAGVWRYHPVQHTFEVVAHGTSNPWGLDFNAEGEAFVTACVIPHLFHIIPGGRYHRQAGTHFNPYTYDDIKTIADHRHYLGATPHGGNSKSDSAGGGHAHAGAMIYQGDAWPKEYQGRIFMNNIHGQRINTDILARKGSGYVGHHGPDFLLTGDQASQMLALRSGPDGNVYVIDWYDMNACHHNRVDGHDRSNGRIYKILYDDAPPRADGTDRTAPVDLRTASDRELVVLAVTHSNVWHQRTALRLLAERAAAGTLSERARKATGQDLGPFSGATVQRVMTMLHSSGGLPQFALDVILAPEFPFEEPSSIQATVIRMVAENPAGLGRPLVEALVNVQDFRLAVRLALASACQRLPVEERWPLAERLLEDYRAADDANLPLMIWYAFEPLVEQDPTRAIALVTSTNCRIPQVRRFAFRRLGEASSVDPRPVFVSALGTTTDPTIQAEILTALATALTDRPSLRGDVAGWTNVAASIRQSRDERLVLSVDRVGTLLGETAAETSLVSVVKDGTDLTIRRQALETLLAVRSEGTRELLVTLLNSPVLRAEAIRGLTRFDAPEIATELLDRWGDLSGDHRRQAVAALATRPAWAKALLEAVADGRLTTGDIPADVARQIVSLNDRTLSERLTSVWGTIRDTPAERQQEMKRLRSLVLSGGHPAPDLTRGRAIFAQTCQRCHVLFGVGDKVGPDITGSNRADLDYLLSNIVDPSAVMAAEYQPTLFALEDGRTLTGLIVSETPTTVTLRTATETITIPVGEIEERVRSKKSMMPDDQLRDFSETDVRNLVAYLRSPTQVPIQATPENVGQFFNGQDLAGWTGDEELWSVENGEIVGQSPGIKKNSFLVSDLAVGDFRLTLEMKLTPNEANSGIQFRSEVVGHEVKGYQADAGKTWWGKLYDELGRGMLYENSAESAVKPNEWNKYVIEARGHQIKTWINDTLSVDFHDPEGPLTGIIALQIHSGGPMDVRFKNLKLEVLEKPDGSKD